MNEPTTDAELDAVLEDLNYDVIDHGDSFSIRSKVTGQQTNLESTDLSDALFEAWNLVR